MESQMVTWAGKEGEEGEEGRKCVTEGRGKGRDIGEVCHREEEK